MTLKKLLTNFLVVSSIYCSTNINPNYLISSYDFTNQNYTYKDVTNFFKSYKDNRFTEYEMQFLYDKCIEYKINILVLSTKLEQENCLVRNSYIENYEKRMKRAMAYGLYYKKKNENGKMYCPYLGFEKQIELGLTLLTNAFYRWSPGKKITLIQNLGSVTPRNAPTYALYTYCPVYGEYDNMGFKCVGNKLFEEIFNIFKTRWSKTKGKKMDNPS